MNTKSLTTIFLAWTFIFQSVAFAVDPTKVSQASEQNRIKIQKVTNKIQARFSKLSDKRKLKFLKRTQRKLKRNIKKLEKMSDRKFSQKLARKTKIAPQSETNASTLSSEEAEIFQDLAQVAVDIDNTQSISIERFQMISGAQEAINEIKAEIENLTYKVTQNLNKNSRKPASLSSKTWNKISYAVLIGLAVGSFFTPIALYILLGIVGAVLVVIGLLFIVVYSIGNSGGDTWPWT